MLGTLLMPRNDSSGDVKATPRFVLGAGLVALVCLASPPCLAKPGPTKPARGKAVSTADRGLELARSGDCVAAVPVLEKAETEGHRPATASALAGCHVALGELVLGFEIYSALASEPEDPGWSSADRAARAHAEGAAAELDARIPRLDLSVAPATADYTVRLAGKELGKAKGPLPVPPDEKVELRVEAEGFEPHVESLVLTEGAKKKLSVTLEAVEGAGPKKPAPPAPTPERGAPYWLGARFRGYLMPSFVMNIAVDGGATTFLPGGEATFTARLADVDLVVGVGVTSLALGSTTVKPHGTPDTEWEIAESDLVALTATLDILYRLTLDDAGAVTMGIGGGVGFGWAAFGELYRWQAYPAGSPDDPSTYAKCKAPNDPPGSFRYCNSLDKDAERYGSPDAAWGSGGARPVIYPWVALPLVSFAFRPADVVEIGLDLGVTFQGFLMGTGLRFGLE
jgi:hypothetical protein